MKIVNSLREKKATKNDNKPAESNLIEGPRLVDLKELGKNLRCCKCDEVLCLDNVSDETRVAFHSTLKVNCPKCNVVTLVSTGKCHRVNNNNRTKRSDITTGVVLGAVHAGYGCSGLNKILACVNMPLISSKIFKRYEREVGPAIEKAAQESCKRAASEERQLVLNNIEKLCEFL
ncbi:GSCOCG00013015001-RA-CDS [Cotesia congregata]|uniref:Mutator-like transposase domain-containing protein n=1 Tax=Cotesia congregata TaxID=51543 RepID=A0A8J2EEZ1_COTCN|nr:GSCOCG00013015001-RA-CDS [Cotesia congregata]CAG5072747.1 Protein of unknown function [Cotesia congregata]